MTAERAQQVPPSAQLLEMIFGFARSRSIAVAAQLGVADQLKDGPKSADEIAASVGAHPRSLYRLLRALAGEGVFVEEADGRFRLTPLSELLRSDAPESLRGFAALMADEVNFETWAQLPYSIETGKPAFPHKHNMPWFVWLEHNPAEAKAFHDAMTSLSAGAAMAVVNAFDFSGINTLVDVGGGHGLLLALVLSRYPNMKGVLYDDPRVIPGANDVLARHSVTDRCELAGGNFFQSVPASGDAYILKHIIHDWSDDECLTILGHCHDGMKAGGKVLIVEMVIPEPNVPSVGKFLDLQMLVFLTGKERTGAEYGSLLNGAGFEMTRIVPTQSPYSVIEGVKK
ncbi:MAG TPA: methyltransferase [Pyrinomonadaceae bacterium]|nr:methyltransferase [Pyrinomonadaceae bacterium]